jgi:multiple sugar transport system permease protein
MQGKPMATNSTYKRPFSIKVRIFFEQFGKHLMIWLVGVLFFIPFIWMASTSLKTKLDIGRVPPNFLPRENRTVEISGKSYPVYNLTQSDGIKKVVALKEYDGSDAVVFDSATPAETYKVPKTALAEILVVKFHWENYVNAITRASRPGLNVTFFTYLKNSLIIALFAIIGTLISCTPVAYAFARIPFQGRDTLFIFVLATMMLPFQVTMIPLFKLFNETLGWGDTFLPLIVPTFFANAWDIFLLRQFFRTIPVEMSDAARVDGANEWQIFTRIIIPLSIPVISTIAVFTFLWAWNDFTGPLIYLQSHQNYTMALGLQDFQGQREVLWNQLMAASVIFTVPIIIAFFFLQKQFIQGIKLTGGKEG